MARTLGLKGVDLSHYQKTTTAGVIMRASDNEPVGHLNEFSFAIVKATHGPAQNSGWAGHSANVRRAGLVLGAYHWLTDTDPIPAQAAKFLEVAKDADFLVVDQEEAGVSDAETQQFIDAIRLAGRPCGLYHSASGFGGVKADFQWVADYRDASVAAGFPRRVTDGVEYPGWDIWQWTSKGGDDGEGLDENWLNPVSPLAWLLRLGYISKSESVAATLAATAPLQAQIVAQQDALELAQLTTQAQAETIAARDATIVTLNEQLSQAATNERNRIAQRVGEREAALIRNL